MLSQRYNNIGPAKRPDTASDISFPRAEGQRRSDLCGPTRATGAELTADLREEQHLLVRSQQKLAFASLQSSM